MFLLYDKIKHLHDYLRERGLIAPTGQDDSHTVLVCSTRTSILSLYFPSRPSHSLVPGC